MSGASAPAPRVPDPPKAGGGGRGLAGRRTDIDEAALVGRVFPPLLLLQVRRELAGEASRPYGAAHHVAPAEAWIVLAGVQNQDREQRHPHPQRLARPHHEECDCERHSARITVGALDIGGRPQSRACPDKLW